MSNHVSTGQTPLTHNVRIRGAKTEPGGYERQKALHEDLQDGFARRQFAGLEAREVGWTRAGSTAPQGEGRKVGGLLADGTFCVDR